MEITLGTWRVSVERTAPEAAELAAMYDAAADRWHRSIGMLGYSRAYRALFVRLFSDGTLGHLEDGGRVLDCGVGTGALSLGLAEKAPAPLRIEGVDVSGRMLDQARRNLKDAAVDARLRTADVRSLPFEDASFDAVICAHVLEHLDDPLEGISEMVRVLRPGGTLVIVATQHSFSDALLQLRWRYTSFEQERLVSALEEAGLCRVRCYPLSEGLLPRLGSVAAVGIRGVRRQRQSDVRRTLSGTRQTGHSLCPGHPEHPQHPRGDRGQLSVLLRLRGRLAYRTREERRRRTTRETCFYGRSGNIEDSERV